MNPITYEGFYILRGFGGVFDVIARQGDLVAQDLKSETEAYAVIDQLTA